jgi:predicted Rossmann fold nucleotide-binding protein DprA/Smf involved in DNA uptake
LIKQGATPVTEADDIASVLRPIIGGDLPAREDDSDETEKSSAEPAPDERARVIALVEPIAPCDLGKLLRQRGNILRRLIRRFLALGRVHFGP